MTHWAQSLQEEKENSCANKIWLNLLHSCNMNH